MRRSFGLGLAAIVASLVGCLFDGAETEGLVCESDAHCGIGIDCIQGVCGGADACGTGLARCVGPDTIQTCEMGVPTPLSCTEACAAAGLSRSFGCEVPPVSGEAGCYCDQTSGTCEQEGVVECADADDIRGCFNGSWDQQDCDRLCASDALGSGDSCGFDPDSGTFLCWCTGNPCVQGEQYCISSDTLAVCETNGWAQYQCGDAGCAPNGVSLGCGFLGTLGDETCLCGE